MGLIYVTGFSAAYFLLIKVLIVINYLTGMLKKKFFFRIFVKMYFDDSKLIQVNLIKLVTL